MFKKIVFLITLSLAARSLYAMDASTSADATKHADLITAIRTENAQRVQELVAGGVNIHTNDDEAAHETLKLKGPIKWEILGLLQDPEGTIKCTICHAAINPKLSADNLKSLVVGDKLFKECRADHCFHADCIGAWVREKEAHHATPFCPYCSSSINPDSAELTRLHTLIPAHAIAHPQTAQTPNNLLVYAAATGSIADMQHALDAGAEINFSAGDPLYYALAAHQLDAAEWLFAHHADINISNGIPLYAVLKDKNWEAAEWLFAHHADINAGSATTLHTVLKDKNWEAAEWLFAHHADINICHGILLSMVLSDKNWQAAEWLFAHHADINISHGILLYAALKDKNWEEAEWLFTHHVDINICDGWPLHMALADKNWETAEWLFTHHADINLSDGIPLHTALAKKNWEAAEWLFTHHADINLSNGILLYAALNAKNLDTTQWLIDHGVDISAHHLRKAKNIGDQAIIDLLYAHSNWQARLAAFTSNHPILITATIVGGLFFGKKLLDRRSHQPH